MCDFKSFHYLKPRKLLDKLVTITKNIRYINSTLHSEYPTSKKYIKNVQNTITLDPTLV